MRTLFGMILGCLLTIGVVYIHDAMATSTVANNSPSISRQIVNWDIALSEWRHVEEGVHIAWLKLKSSFND